MTKKKKVKRVVLGEGIVINHSHEIFAGRVSIEIAHSVLKESHYIGAKKIRLIAEVLE